MTAPPRIWEVTNRFARLGYDTDSAGSLAESGLMYMNIAAGIDNINTATESLTSTMKAFGIEAQNSMSIVDMFTQVGKRELPMPVVTRWLAECYNGQSRIGMCA